jgi:L-ascorbate metabolism protein UlaG (beta-lactamase superfamily)
MAAVDGGMTLDLPTMLKVIERLRSSVIIPMHWFSDWSLQEFLEEVPEGFDIVDRGENALTVSLRTLPSRPTVVVLRPSYLGFD